MNSSFPFKISYNLNYVVKKKQFNSNCRFASNDTVVVDAKPTFILRYTMQSCGLFISRLQN